jgi:hypothetical protein
MGEELFAKIKRIINEGGKVKIINRKGVELDITTEMRSGIISYNVEIDAYEEKLGQQRKKFKHMIHEMAELAAEVQKLKPIRDIYKDYLLRTKLYEETPEGKLVKRITETGMKDVNAVLQNYDSNKDGLKKIYDKYQQHLGEEIGFREESYQAQLDSLEEYYKGKFRS